MPSRPIPTGLPSTLDVALEYIEQHLGTRYIFPIFPGEKSPPLISDNLEMASNNFQRIRDWHARWPGCTWAVSLKKSGLLVADVDVGAKKRLKAGVRKPWVEKIDAKGRKRKIPPQYAADDYELVSKRGMVTYDALDLAYGWPETETVRSQSGGLHLYFEGVRAGPIVDAFGEDIDCPNYVILPGCMGYSLEKAIDAVPVPQWMTDYFLRSNRSRSVDSSTGAYVELDQEPIIAWAIAYLREDAAPCVAGEGGNVQLFKVFAALRERGVSQEAAVMLVADYFNERCDPPWDYDDLETTAVNAFTYANLSGAGRKSALWELNDDEETDPLVPMGDPKLIEATAKTREKLRADRAAQTDDERAVGKTLKDLISEWIYVGTADMYYEIANPCRPLKKTAFDSVFRQAMPTEGGGPKSASEYLLTNPGFRRFQDMQFVPGKPMSINRGTTYNTYTTPDIIPAPGDTSWWDDHLRYLFDDESRMHVENWIAWFLQNLTKKPHHLLLIQGEVQGTGKSFIAKAVMRLIHPSNTSIVPQSALSGSFNGWAARAKLVLIEELRAQDRQEVVQALHDVVTEPRISINEKGIRRYDIDNVMGIIATTNSPDAIMFDSSDRRYLVVRTDAQRRDTDYYDTLFARLDDPIQMGHLYDRLLQHDCGSYRGSGAAPASTAKAQMSEANRTDMEEVLLDMRATWLSGRMVNIQEIVAELKSLAGYRGNRTYASVVKFLRQNMQGQYLGTCPTAQGRKRLWAIGPQAAFLKAQTPAVVGKLFDEDRKKQPPGSAGALEDFGD